MRPSSRCTVESCGWTPAACSASARAGSSSRRSSASSARATSSARSDVSVLRSRFTVPGSTSATRPALSSPNRVFATSKSERPSSDAMVRRSRWPSTMANISHSGGSKSSPPWSPSAGAASAGTTPKCGMRPSIRDHSSMRRAPSMSSASVGMRTVASFVTSVSWPSVNEKYPSRQLISSNTTSSTWKRICRSSSRGVMAPSATRISPIRRLSPCRSCMSRPRSRSASVILPVRSSRAPSGCGFERISAKMMVPPSKYTVPALCRSSEVTRSTPVLRLRSSSWKTSWMPSSRSGPSIAMG